LLESLKLTDNGKINAHALPERIRQKYDFSKEYGLEKYRRDILAAFEVKREAFNLTEAFATSFTSGLADEKTAYLAMGQAYCREIEPYENVLIYFNHEGFYKNTVILYTLWDKRLNKDKIIQEVTTADAETESARKALNKKQEALAKIKKEISNIEDKEIVSLGTDDEDS